MRFYGFGQNDIFAVMTEKCDCGFGGEMIFCTFSGNFLFCGFGGKMCF